MGRDRKEDLEKALDNMLMALESGNIPEGLGIDVDKIDFSSLSKDDIEHLLKKVNYIIETISKKQEKILKSISDKSDLKGYQF